MELSIGARIGNSSLTGQGTISLFVSIREQLGFLTTGTIFSRKGEPVFIQHGTTYVLIGSVRELSKTIRRNFAIILVRPGITGKNIYTDKGWLETWWPTSDRATRFHSVPIGSWKVPLEVRIGGDVYLIRDGNLIQGKLKQINVETRAGDGRLGVGKIACHFEVPANTHKGHGGDLLVALYPFSQMLHPIGILWGLQPEFTLSNPPVFVIFTPLRPLFDTGDWCQLLDSPDTFEAELSTPPDENTPEIDPMTSTVQSAYFSLYDV